MEETLPNILNRDIEQGPVESAKGDCHEADPVLEITEHVGTDIPREEGGAIPEERRIGRIYFKSSSKGIQPMHSHRESKPENWDSNITWSEVCRSCCVRSPKEWATISVNAFALLGLLYFFLLGLELLGSSFKVVGGCTAGSLLGSDQSPLSSVMIGIIVTAILQSSSTTVAIIVSLVSGGLDVKQGIYLVMGANLGTSVTAMAVSIAHISDLDELRRAFSGSATLCLFNLFTMIILFPLELSSGYLYHLTKAMLPDSVSDGEAWEGPIKQIVSPVGNRIIMPNKSLIKEVADGISCDSYYPVECENDIESYDTCRAGLIGCNSKNNKCPAFFQVGASKNDDMVSGWVMLLIALFLLIFCLIGMVGVLRRMLLGASRRIIYKATNINGYLGIVIGCAVTVFVQSSSITVSSLVPLAGVGLITLEKMLPLVIGADLGTTITGFLASMVSDSIEALQIALVHLFFNVTGALLWYPVPLMRQVLLSSASRLGRVAREWRQFPIVFVVLVYYVIPILIVGISTCFEKQKAGFTALGIFLVLLVCGISLRFAYYWKFQEGRMEIKEWLVRRQRREAAIRVLADDIDYLKVDTEWCKNEIGRLKDYAGIPRGVIPKPPSSISLAIHEIGSSTFVDDDLLSLYHSVQSSPWTTVLSASLRDANASIDSFVGSSRRPASRVARLRESHRMSGSRRGGASSYYGSSRQINPEEIGDKTGAVGSTLAF